MFSWLGRVANAHGISLNKLKKNLPFNRCKSAFEYDKVVTREQLSYLSRRSGASIDKLKGLTFHSTVGAVMPQIQGVRNRWVLRFKKQPVTPICVDCLNSNTPFYYRLHWRYAFVTHCHKHGSMLIDKCEACGTYLNVYNYILNTKEFDRYEVACPSCGHLLYRLQGTNSNFQPALNDAYYASMESQLVDLKGERINSVVYFELIHILASLLSGSRSSHNLFETAILNIEDIEVDYKCCELIVSSKLDIENRSVLERCQLFEIILKILESVDLTTLLYLVSEFHFYKSCWKGNLKWVHFVGPLGSVFKVDSLTSYAAWRGHPRGGPPSGMGLA